MVVINLFGSPGAGKSTLASDLNGFLNRQGYTSELIPEFAKYLSFSGFEKALKDQLFIFASQNHQLEVRVGSGVDFLVLDSPLPLSVIYSRRNHPKGYLSHFEPLVKETFEKYENLNFFLTKSHNSYRMIGRHHNELESEEISKETLALLRDWGIAFKQFGSLEAFEEIKKILKRE